MPTEFVLLVFLLIGILLLFFRKGFVEISSHSDWIFGHRFGESMKRLKGFMTIVLGGSFVTVSIVELYPYLEKRVGKTLSVMIYIILIILIFYIISLTKKNQEKISKKTINRY